MFVFIHAELKDDNDDDKKKKNIHLKIVWAEWASVEHAIKSSAFCTYRWALHCLIAHTHTHIKPIQTSTERTYDKQTNRIKTRESDEEKGIKKANVGSLLTFHFTIGSEIIEATSYTTSKCLCEWIIKYSAGCSCVGACVPISYYPSWLLGWLSGWLDGWLAGWLATSHHSTYFVIKFNVYSGLRV